MAGETTRIRNLNVVAEALRRTQEQYRLLAEQASDGILVTDPDGRLLDANPAASTLLDYTRPELLSLRLRYLLHDDELKKHPGLLDELQRVGSAPRELRLRRKDEKLIRAFVDARPLQGGGLQITIRDRGETSAARRALEESEQRFLRLLHSAPDAILLETENRIAIANDACAQLLGFREPRDLVGLVTTTLINPEKRDNFKKNVSAIAGTQRTAPSFQTRLQRLDGSQLDGHIIATATSFRGLPAVQLVVRETAPSQTPKLSTKDSLTGLPGRELFEDRVSVALAQAFRQRQVLAVIRIEIGGLAAANENHGRRGGDELLRAAAERLTSCIREGDTVARLAATEFGLLLPGVRYQDDVTTIADKVFGRLREPVEIESESVTLGANAGISLFPEDGDGTDALLANAADAMGRARKLGSGHYLLYAATTERDPLEALGSGSHALSTSLIGTHHEGTPGVLHYQPVYNLETQRIEGVETFLRWQHPELGLVFPRHFLLGADFTGLILAIGPWILRTACAQVRTWQRRDHRTLRLAVNLSSHELRDPNLVQNVGTALSEANLAPRFLQLEVPEDWAMSDVGHAADVIGGLRALGVSVCLDGFGDDPSSMLQLRHLPVDAVKLNLFGERSVSPDGGEEATRVASAVAMAKSFHLRVIAQGVESRDLIDQLRSWQCDEVQGYHWGAPMSPARCETLLRGLSGRLLTGARPALASPAAETPTTQSADASKAGPQR